MLLSRLVGSDNFKYTGYSDVNHPIVLVKSKLLSRVSLPCPSKSIHNW